MDRIRVLTWHVHGNYLLYLSQADVDFFLPFEPGRPGGYGGRGNTFPFGPNVRELPAREVRNLDVDCVLYQTRANYESDRHTLLSEAQRRGPSVYLEHDPPQERPTDQRHWYQEPDGLLVHVTHFNALMWDSGATPTRVIEHGVFVPDDARYTGELERGLVVINHLKRRGRRLGLDVFEAARAEVPLDLVGMDAESLGGLGEVAPMSLTAAMARYRFFFHPVRYTSLGLAVLEAMAVGLPVVGLATTELATVIDDRVSGYVHTDPAVLVDRMRRLLAEPAEARRLGEAGRRVARERFHIGRFQRDWEGAFAAVTGLATAATPAAETGVAR